MNIKILLPDPIKASFASEAIGEYVKRIKPYAKIELIDSKQKWQGEPEQVRKAQTTWALEKVKERDFLIFLDEDGKEFDSENFAETLSKAGVSGVSNFIFAVGGAYGWEKQELKKAESKKAMLILSLSKFTFPYQIASVVLVEQIYRALMIINKRPYHKV